MIDDEILLASPQISQIYSFYKLLLFCSGFIAFSHEIKNFRIVVTNFNANTDKTKILIHIRIIVNNIVCMYNRLKFSCIFCLF